MHESIKTSVIKYIQLTGKKHDGLSSPANPALIVPEPFKEEYSLNFEHDITKYNKYIIDDYRCVN